MCSLEHLAQYQAICRRCNVCILGTLNQRATEAGWLLTIHMKKLTLWIIALVTTAGSALFAQDAIRTRRPKTMAADAAPQFEVATIKPSQSRDAGGSFNVNPSGLVSVTSFPVMVLIRFSYNVTRRQISGGPSWLESDRFDIVGKPDMEGTPNLSQLRVALQFFARSKDADTRSRPSDGELRDTVKR
jgi:Protein of unknown function (DUF3738)